MEMNSLEFFLLIFLDDIFEVFENIVRVFNGNLLISTEKPCKLYSILFNSWQLFITAVVSILLVENQDRQILKLSSFDISHYILYYIMCLVHFSSYLPPFPLLNFSGLSILVVCLSDEMPRILFDIIVVGAARAGDHISDGDLASGSNISHIRVMEVI